MQLSRRPAIYSLPSYSLTGDLLGFLRCGLQYRYTNIGHLPSTRPVQMWFGQFIHGVLEESYRRYDTARTEGQNDLPPWPKTRIEEITGLIKRRLAAQGLFPWRIDLEELGDARAEAAVNDLGPEIFPLIRRAEVRLTGTRELPVNRIPSQFRFREADRYEMVGVIDVITNVEIDDPTLQTNRLVKPILAALPAGLPDRFEVIIDYKGMRRPPIRVQGNNTGPGLWDIYEWQVQTYANLRRVQEDSLPVVAGVILYTNELLPSRGDLIRLRKEIQAGITDVMPPPGSTTEQRLKTWNEKADPPALPLDFRLERAMHVVVITPQSIQMALPAFDDVVARIEICRGRELQTGRVLSTWDKNPSDENTCTACDARTFCPDYVRETFPRLPAVRVKP